MNRSARIIFCLWIIGGLSACNLPARPNLPSLDGPAAQQYETVSVLLTATAAKPAAIAPAPSQTPALTPTSRATPTARAGAASTLPAEVTPTPAAAASNVESQGLPCDLAHAGRPIDVSIPDETRMRPGEYFSKTWRLVNSGTCVWTREYAVIWFSGDDLGLNREQDFITTVEPGKTIDITVDMMAPQEPGVYQSNWKLRNESGDFFGIGPNGGAPFWVRIIVVAVDTPTSPATPLVPTQTQEPVVLIQRKTSLKPAGILDLDPGKSTGPDQNDIAYLLSADKNEFLAPANGARVAPFGIVAPTREDCMLSVTNDTPIALRQYLPGAYFCYRTSEGLPGWLLLSAIDLQNQSVDLEYLTWAAP